MANPNWVKGFIPWNKGIHCSKETKKKISNSNKGHIPWNKNIKMPMKINQGRNNPMYGKHHSKEAIEKIRKESQINPNIIRTQFKKGHPAPKTAFKKGQRPHNFNNYSSFEPYGKEFNNQLKEFIKNKYHFRCQQCFRHQDELDSKLHIHHIDYNKKNNNPKNLISLCRNCHQQTNFKREDWKEYYKEKVVP